MRIERNPKIGIIVGSAMCSILMMLSITAPAVESYRAFGLDAETAYLQQYADDSKQLDQIIGQTDTLTNQMSDLEAAKNSSNDAKIQQLQQQIDTNDKSKQALINDMNHLQDESRALYQIDPQDKQRLDEQVKIISDKYMVKKSSTYVGDNPVREIFAHYDTKSISIQFDPDLTIKNPSGDTSQTIIDDIKKTIGNTPLVVSYDKIYLTQCSSVYGVCSPLVGGDAIEASSKTFPCSEGYEAVDYASKSGFIMAGHCGNYSNTVYQPPPGYTGSTSVGSENQYCYDKDVTCDFAFVRSTNVNFKIFKDGTNWYSISAKTPQSSQSSGTIVTEKGVGDSSPLTGAITASNTSTGQVTVNFSAVGGDSGAPAFYNIDGTNVDVYGMMWGVSGSSSYYYAEDYIASTLSLTG